MEQEQLTELLDRAHKAGLNFNSMRVMYFGNTSFYKTLRILTQSCSMYIYCQYLSLLLGLEHESKLTPSEIMRLVYAFVGGIQLRATDYAKLIDAMFNYLMEQNNEKN